MFRISLPAPALVCLLLVPTLAGAQVTAKLVASRTQGPAPLYVMFDATGSTTTAWGCNSLDTLNCGPSTLGGKGGAFHHLLYEFQFGEKNADSGYNATWGDDTKLAFHYNFSKDRYYGAPLAAHVYDKPGTYVASVKACQGDGTCSTTSVQIQVQDPDQFYSGSSTLCVRDSASRPACSKSGARDIISSQVSSFCSSLSTNTRVLIEGGSTVNGSCQINSDGVTIGSYGSGRARIVNQATGSNFVIRLGTVSDVRIHDVALQIAGGSSSVCTTNNCRWFWSDSNAKRMLVYHVTFDGYGRNNVGTTQEFGFVANDTTNGINQFQSGYNGLNVMLGKWSAVMGNRMGQSGEHNLRLFGGTHGVVTFNYPDEPPQSTKTLFKINGAADNNGNSTEPLLMTVVGYNGTDVDSGGWGSMVGIGCKNDKANCEIRDVIVEGNFDSKMDAPDRYFRASAERVTMRYNVVSGTAKNMIGSTIRGDTSALHVSRYFWLYGNSCYTTRSDSANCVRAVGGTLPAFAWNNLLFAPNDPGAQVVDTATDLGGNVMTHSSPFRVASPGSDIRDYYCGSSTCNDKGLPSRNDRPDLFGLLNRNDGNGLTPDAGAMRDGTLLAGASFTPPPPSSGSTSGGTASGGSTGGTSGGTSTGSTGGTTGDTTGGTTGGTTGSETPLGPPSPPILIQP